MNKQRGSVDESALVMIALLVITALCLLYSSFSCQVKASKMGMNSSWGLLQGCMIEYKPKKWIDIERYRAFDEDKP